LTEKMMSGDVIRTVEIGKIVRVKLFCVRCEMNPIACDAIAISTGAICGAITRYQCGRMATEYLSSRYKNDISKQSTYLGWHTAFINISGSFILGAVAAAPTVTADGSRTATVTNGIANSKSLYSQISLSKRSKLLLGVGFCGSYTTFSTYSVDVVTWMMNGQTTKALSYLAINNVGGIAAAAVGLILTKKIFGHR
jgi:fluoride ion exporter CrcB/FEX